MTIKMRLRVLALAILLLSGLALAPAKSAAPQAPVESRPHGQSVQKKRPMTPRSTQRIYAPLPPHEWVDAELALNNNSADILTVTTTFFNEGMPASGTPVTLKPAEVRWLRLSDLNAPTGRAVTTNDGLQLEYLGHMLEVGAQVTLLRKAGAAAVDVPFSAAGEYHSSVQEAVWPAPPGTRSVVVLANTSDVTVGITVEQHNRESDYIEIAPHVTRALDRRSDVKGRSSAGFDWMRIDVRGPIGSVRASGFAEVNGRLTSPIRFYDPGAVRQPNLYATNLRLRDMATLMVLKNTSDATVTVRPRFLAFDPSSSVDLKPLTLAPHAATSVDLGTLHGDAADAKQMEHVSVEVVNSGPPGSLIGGLVAIASKGDAYDIPLRDSGPIRQATGSYPWRLDGDYNTTITISNVSETTATFHGQITHAGGVYVIQDQELPANATATFDLTKLRKKGVIPSHVTSGQFRWSIVRAQGQTKLNGRAEIVSVADNRRSSYSCGSCCPDSWAYGQLNPSSLNPPVGFSAFADIYGWYDSCYAGSGLRNGPFNVHLTSWRNSNPPVVSASTVSTARAEANGLSEGSATIEAYGPEDAWDIGPGDTCIEVFLEAQAPAQVFVPCAKPVNYRQTNQQVPVPGRLEFEYRWDSNTGRQSDLSACEMREHVTYDPWPFPSPPFNPNATLPNPHIVPWPATDFVITDVHSTAEPHTAPYSAVSVYGGQNYQYRCPCDSFGSWVTMLSPLGGIARVFSQEGPSWFFTISKLGLSSRQGPLP
jgi:hypothetical protein